MEITRVQLTTVDELNDCIRAKLFGELVKLALPHLRGYHSDLYRDAQWVAKHVDGPVTFYYAAGETGTYIGTTLALVAVCAPAVHRVELARVSGWWLVTTTGVTSQPTA